MQRRFLWYLTILLLVVAVSFNITGPALAQAVSRGSTINFENGVAGWQKNRSTPAISLLWDENEGHASQHSIQISTTTPGNAEWVTPIKYIEPHNVYRLSGWIKTENVASTGQPTAGGAYLTVVGVKEHSVALFGTNDWTYVSLSFNTERRQRLIITAQLGATAAPTTGRVWFDDLKLSADMEGEGPFLFWSSTPGYDKFDQSVYVSNPASQAREIYFRGLSVGIRTVDALAMLNDGTILLSMSTPQPVPGLGNIETADIIRFIPEAPWLLTKGRFERYFDGSDVGLESEREDVDAIELLEDGSLLVSTTGNFVVPGPTGDLIGNDEDILRFQPVTLGPQTSGSWSLYFDGSDINLDLPTEDIGALTVAPQTGDLYFKVKGYFHAGGIYGDSSSLLICKPLSLGEDTSCQLSLWSMPFDTYPNPTFADAIEWMVSLPPWPTALSFEPDDQLSASAFEEVPVVEDITQSPHTDKERDLTDSWIFLPLIAN